MFIVPVYSARPVVKKINGETVSAALYNTGLFLNTLSCRYRHVNLLQLIACSMDGPTPCLIYDYMEQGSLLDVLQRRVNTYTIVN